MTNGLDYMRSQPIIKAIKKINKYFDKGHKIIIWTARGAVSGIDWSETTKKQLQEWGVKYHELSFNKPSFDILFDDKARKI
jgi:hypothetical protein